MYLEFNFSKVFLFFNKLKKDSLLIHQIKYWCVEEPWIEISGGIDSHGFFLDFFENSLEEEYIAIMETDKFQC